MLFGLFALEGVGQVYADCVVFLDAQLAVVVGEGGSLGEVAELLEDVLVGFVEVDEDRVFEVDVGLGVFDIGYQPFEEVVDIWLEDHQSSFLVIAVSSDCLGHEYSVGCALHQP